MDIEFINVMIKAACLILCFTYIYGENPFYRLAEHMFIGLAAGHYIVMGIKNIDTLALAKIRIGYWWYFIPVVIGLLIYTRFYRKYLWISRYPYAIMIAVAIGLGIAGQFDTNWFQQTRATLMLPLTSFDNIFIIVGTILASLYFVFTKEQKGLYGRATQVGRWIMMFYFGITFGSVTMARMSVLIWNIYFLTTEPAIYVTVVAIISASLILGYKKLKRPVEAVVKA
jgi:hypothetical protein